MKAIIASLAVVMFAASPALAQNAPSTSTNTTQSTTTTTKTHAHKPVHHKKKVRHHHVVRHTHKASVHASVKTTTNS